MAQGETDQIFNKALLVCVKEHNAVQISKKTPLHITVEQTTISSPLVKRELMVRLTDEEDPFFLYHMVLTEEDFQNLKVQQGLLVDFPAFPHKFLDLLGQCLEEQSKEVPRFVLSMAVQGRLGQDSGRLEVVETNPFKHLVHLSLSLLPASDCHVKKYLAACLKSAKEDKAKLLRTVTAREAELAGAADRRVRQAAEEEKLKAEMGAQAARHRQELASLREVQEKERRQEETAWAQRLLETESRQSVKLQQLEARVSCLDTLNRELQEKRHQSEQANQGLRERISQLETELRGAGTQRAREVAEAQDREGRLQEMNQALAAAQNQVSGLETQLRDLRDTLRWEQEALHRARHEAKDWEEKGKEKQALVHKRESEAKKLAQELLNGNELLKKLQDELRSSQARMKLRDKLALKQEGVIAEKDSQLKKLSQESQDLLAKIHTRDQELQDLREKQNALQKEVEDFQKKQRSNESVIKWLNKQLAEQKLQTEHRTHLTSSRVQSTPRPNPVYVPAPPPPHSMYQHSAPAHPPRPYYSTPMSHSSGLSSVPPQAPPPGSKGGGTLPCPS